MGKSPTKPHVLLGWPTQEPVALTLQLGGEQQSNSQQETQSDQQSHHVLLSFTRAAVWQILEGWLLIGVLL